MYSNRLPSEEPPRKKIKLSHCECPSSSVNSMRTDGQLLHALRELQQQSNESTKANVMLLLELKQQVTEFSAVIRQQQYAIDGLKREISDLQVHAIHGFSDIAESQAPYNYQYM